MFFPVIEHADSAHPHTTPFHNGTGLVAGYHVGMPRISMFSLATQSIGIINFMIWLCGR